MTTHGPTTGDLMTTNDVPADSDVLPIHGKGEGWLTGCGQDRANVVKWTDDPSKVTCSVCAAAGGGGR